MRPRTALPLAIGGCLAMAAAVGIGRFLYTPALPLMGAEAGLGPQAAGWVASANFAGYLAGALIAALPGFSARARAWMAAALALSALTTALMAATHAPLAWALLRFAGGMASAFVLVFASALVTARLKAGGQGQLTSVHFAGVGLGIFLSA
ncbi:MAG: YbfB/YjiJ family MFS transporter, partial [Pseudomonadota bacterium]